MNGPRGSWLILPVFLFSCAAAMATDRVDTSQVASQRLAHAEEWQGRSLRAKVLNPSVTIHWLPSSGRFWFKRQTAAGDDFVVFDAATGRQSNSFDSPARVRAPVVTSATLESTIWSPDQSRGVFRRDNDLWLREAAGGQERPLTNDGVANFAYGDVDNYFDLARVMRRRHGQKEPLQGVSWSPDGKWILALRQDLRAVPERLTLTEYLPPDGRYAVPYFSRVGVAGDAQRPDSYLVLIDADTGTVRPLRIDSQALNDWALLYLIDEITWWSRDGRSLYIICANRGGSRYRLAQIDLATGNVRDVITESSRFGVRLNPSDYSAPNVYVTRDAKEAVWYSERSGYGHLYLYDIATGREKRALTRGDWVVADLLHVDERSRLIYFTAVGREPGNPYFRRLYRVSLDGGEPRLLTPEDADHDFRNPFGVFRTIPKEEGSGVGSVISPDGRYFVDSFSTVRQPTKVVVRKTDGSYVGTVIESDVSRLRAAGWSAPEPVKAQAADGRTDLYGVLFKPKDFDPAKRYPVIDYPYPGPQGRWAPISFEEGLSNAQAYAEMGFIVVVLDGRGTTYRSRQFADAFLGTEDVFGIADQVAAIQSLAKSRSHMDLSRVGITGGSFGGYAALRALLLYPGFFKVAVSGVGPGQWLDFPQAVSVERFFGVPAESEDIRSYYDQISNIRLLDRLQGKILLIYGGIDENVPLKSAFEVIDGFIKADKRFDLIVVPDADHAAGNTPYAFRRSLEYFTNHLIAPED